MGISHSSCLSIEHQYSSVPSSCQNNNLHSLSKSIRSVGLCLYKSQTISFSEHTRGSLSFITFMKTDQSWRKTLLFAKVKMKFSWLTILWKMINHAKKSFFFPEFSATPPSLIILYKWQTQRKTAFILFLHKTIVDFYLSFVHIVNWIRQLLLDSVQQSLSVRSGGNVASDTSLPTTEYVNSIRNTTDSPF